VKLLWLRRAREDYERWRETDPAVYKHINALIRDIQQRPHQGLGRPKALQLGLKGWWSREITVEHRLVYRVRVKGGKWMLEIAQCRFHYDD
jgi:toxin YoeB